MTTLADLGHSASRLLGNMNLVKAVLAINAGAAATVRTTGALTFLVDGIQYTRAALANVALQALAAADLPASMASFVQPSGSTGFVVQPAGTTVFYVLAVNTAGTVRTVQGNWNGQQISLQGLTQVGKSVIPDTPDGWIPFGIIKVVTGAATFTPGTTALDAANVTASYFDVAVLPSAAAI